MDSRENDIKNLLVEYFDGVYCDTCEFNNLTEEEAIEKYEYYGCEWCNRKSMNYKLSEECAEYLVDTIINIVNGEEYEI